MEGNNQMNKLLKLHIQGFKKFKDHIVIPFNKSKNILIGDNGVGKSTTLQALSLILRNRTVQHYSQGESELGNLLNSELKLGFERNNSVWNDTEKLPKIIIAIEFRQQDNFLPGMAIFDGNVHPKNCDEWGLGNLGMYFEYSFNKDFEDEYQKYVSEFRDTNEDMEIPFEFYTAKWQTFSGTSYNYRLDPFKTILVDNDNWNGDPYNNFTKQIFRSLDSRMQTAMKTTFRKNAQAMFKDVIGEKPNYDLKINPNSIRLESILEIFENNISLKEMGSGTENLIKTNISLENDSQLVLIEEPENHLSAINTRKQIKNIENKLNGTQLILTTHNPDIISRLNIKNALWFRNSNGKTSISNFNELDDDSITYFNKVDNLDFLKLITSKKVILVEGTSEYLLMNTFLEKISEKKDTLENVEVISMPGRYYEPFYNLSTLVKNKILIFTDNDGDQTRINDLNQKNTYQDNVKVYCPKDTEDWTFESSIYNLNDNYIEEHPYSEGAKSTKYKHKENLPVQLVYMLHNKTQTAMQMDVQFQKGNINIPEYIKDGIKWLTT